MRTAEFLKRKNDRVAGRGGRLRPGPTPAPGRPRPLGASPAPAACGPRGAGPAWPGWAPPPGLGGAPCRPRRAERAEGTRAELPPCPSRRRRRRRRRRSVAGPESAWNTLLAASHVAAPAGAASPPAHTRSGRPGPASALCSSSPPRTGLHSGAAPAAAAGAAAADRGALQVVPGEAAAVPGQDVFQVHLHPAARRGGGKASGCGRTTGRGWRPAYAPPPAPGEPGGLGPALGVPGPAEGRGPGRAPRGRADAGAAGLAPSGPPALLLAPGRRGALSFAQEGGRGSPAGPAPRPGSGVALFLRWGQGSRGAPGRATGLSPGLPGRYRKWSALTKTKETA